MELFRRDCFMDRYTNLKLVIPPSLRVISEILPIEFPYHPHWAEGKCHDSYWDLSATADHKKPVAANGSDNMENLVTTSMSKNLQKNSIDLDDLGWTLYFPDNKNNWDGLSSFYIEQCHRNPRLLKQQYFRDWYNAVKNK